MTFRARTALAAACGVLSLICIASGQRLSLEPQPDATWEPIAQIAPRDAVVQPVDQPPTLDGKLDDPAWKQVQTLGPFSHLGGLDPAAAQWVDMRLALHEGTLYVGARLANPGTTLRALIRDNGGRIWTDDSLELFFHHASTAATFQVDVNANGAWWSGVKGATAAWSPAVRTAATRDDAGWTVELAIPLTDLPMARGGESAVPFAARYLVRNQAGYASWAPEQPGQMGLLCFREDQRPGGKLQLQAKLMPSTLPADGGAVGVRMHNPTDKPRTGTVRLTRQNDPNWSLTQRVTIEPGQTRDVRLRHTPPAQPQSFVLLAQDGAGGQWTFREDRRIGTRPDFNIALLRERLWYGEKQVEGELELGVLDEELAATTLSVSLFSRTHQLEQTPPLAMTSGRYAMTVDLEGLPPGPYKLVVERRGPRGHKTDIRDLNLEQGMKLPAVQRVALQLDWPDNVGDEAPVYCGLSLPGGSLTDLSTIRVVDDAGLEVPVQVDPLATWSPAGSLRWVALRFTARRDRHYHAEVGGEVARRALGKEIQVSETGSAIVVDTGAARWELPRVGPLLGKAWIGQTQVLAGDRPVLVLRDQAGEVADETRNTREEWPIVEVAGPRHVVIRREGLYRTAGGTRLGKYVARVAFDVGSPVAHLQHSFIVTEDSDRVQYADVAVQVAPALAGPWQVTVPHGSRRYESRIDPSSGGVYLSQLVYPHFQKPESRYEIGQRQGEAWSVQGQGEVAGNWAAATRGDGAGVSVAIRDFARTFPKELQVGDGLMIAHLWSSRGGRMLDYRPSTLVEHWGLDWSATYPGGIEKLKAIKATAAGTARTHDVAIQLLAPRTPIAQVEQAALRLDQPVLAIQDPHWLRATEALGPLHPYDPRRFPRIEAFTRNVFERLFVEQAENCGDFGYLDHGNGPHTMTRTPTDHPGKGHRPRLGYRYTNIEYHGRTAMWLAYARSGDRLYRDYAAPFTRHLYDYRFSYFTGPKRKIGGILGGSVSEDVPMYWAGWTGHDDVGMYAGHQGIDLANFQMQYFLTGDRRAMDGPTLFAQRLVEDFDPMQLPNVGSTSSACMALALPAQVYFQTWDPRIGRKLQVARQRALDLRTSTGLAQQDYYGALYKWPVRHWGTLEDYKVTGAALSRDALLRGLPMLLSHVPEPFLGYQDHSGAFANYAAGWTDDPRWASYIHARIATTVAAFSDVQGNIVGNFYVGTHNANFPQVVAYGLDLIARDQDRIQPYPQLELMTLDQTPPIWLRKQTGQDLHVDITHRPQWDLRLAHHDERFEHWRGSYYGGPLHVTGRFEPFARTAPGLAEGYLRMQLPPDMVPGDYEMLGISSVLSGTADKLVALVREGIYLPGDDLEPQRWFVPLPAGATGRLYVSRDCELIQHDQPRALAGGQWHDLSNPGSEEAIATLAVHGLTYIRFSGGIPAVLAEHDAARLFIPQGTSVEPMELPEPASAQADFVPGRSGRDDDQAVMVSRTDLSIPAGRQLEAKHWEHLDWREGTLEFWYQPRWTSDMQTKPVLGTFVGGTAMPFAIEYHHQVPTQLDRRTLFHNMGALKLLSPGGENSWYNLSLVNTTSLRQGRWTHIAVCWRTEPEGRGWLAELYRDGLGSGFEGGGRNAAGPYHIHENEPGFKRFVPRPRGDVKNPAIWLLSTLDGAIDDLRISDIVRYPAPFEVGSVRVDVADKHTLLLLRFDGTLDAVAPRSEQPVSARRGR